MLCCPKDWGKFITTQLSSIGNNRITFNISKLPSEYHQPFIRALNTWRCKTNINFDINSSYGIPVLMGKISSGKLGLTTFEQSICLYDEQRLGRPTRMVFNQDKLWSVSTGVPPAYFDFESSALHEIGHALGLIHTNNSLNVMFPSTQKVGVDFRSLTQDDCDGGMYCQSRSLAAMPPPEECGIALTSLTGDCELDISTFTTKTYKSNSSLVVIPNPTSDLVNITVSDVDFNYTLYSQSGQLLKEAVIQNSNKTILDLSDFSAGIYFLKIIVKNESLYRKILKL